MQIVIYDNLFYCLTKLQLIAEPRSNLSSKYFGTGIDIVIYKNVYICINQKLHHVRTFNSRDFQRKSFQL
jgi:hypothetical protein